MKGAAQLMETRPKWSEGSTMEDATWYRLEPPLSDAIRNEPTGEHIEYLIAHYYPPQMQGHMRPGGDTAWIPSPPRMYVMECDRTGQLLRDGLQRFAVELPSEMPDYERALSEFDYEVIR